MTGMHPPAKYLNGMCCVKPNLPVSYVTEKGVGNRKARYNQQKINWENFASKYNIKYIIKLGF